ncbi:18980_t:CDS:2, partial [Gigaspora rosea]
MRQYQVGLASEPAKPDPASKEPSKETANNPVEQTTNDTLCHGRAIGDGILIEIRKGLVKDKVTKSPQTDGDDFRKTKFDFIYDKELSMDESGKRLPKGRSWAIIPEQPPAKNGDSVLGIGRSWVIMSEQPPAKNGVLSLWWAPSQVYVKANMCLLCHRPRTIMFIH